LGVLLNGILTPQGKRLWHLKSSHMPVMLLLHLSR